LLRLPAVEDNAAMEAEPPKADPPKRKLRWFQFSLRSLLVMTLIVGLVMTTWIVPIKRRANKQDAAVVAILNSGGSVVYDYQKDALRMGIRNPEPPGLRWLRAVLGDNYRAEVVEVQLYSGVGAGMAGRPYRHMTPDTFTDAEAEKLAACTELRLLVLADTKITDAGIKCFQNMRKLEGLNVEGTLVTKPAVMELHRALPNARIIFGNDEVLGPPRSSGLMR
jgi:hypothetical protein